MAKLTLKENLKEKLIRKDYIPLDKSWMNRMGVLDLVHGHSDSINFLGKILLKLNEDLKALYKASLDWNKKQEIDVGESGTLYRFLKFASWKLNLDKSFILYGTLKDRKICNNPEIVNCPLKELLKLDNGTSQWASASVLLGNKEKIDDVPFKLKLSYEAVEHWTRKRKEGKCWEPRYDETILAQALAYLDILNFGISNNRIPIFAPQQAEDYCFARAFGLITREEGESKWPSLHGHESDRIVEVEKELESAEAGKGIESKDHRVIQAIAMLQKTNGKPVKVKYPSAVNKSWPMFWRFLEYSSHL